MRALRGLTKLTELNLRFCSHVSNVGRQHLSSLSALTYLNLSYTTTTQAGRDALTAALPATETDGYVKFSVLQAASAATRCSWRRCFAVRERSIPQTCSLCVTLSCRPVAAGREGATLAVGQAKWYTLSFGATEQARLAITSLTRGQGRRKGGCFLPLHWRPPHRFAQCTREFRRSTVVRIMRTVLTTPPTQPNTGSNNWQVCSQVRLTIPTCLLMHIVRTASYRTAVDSLTRRPNMDPTSYWRAALTCKAIELYSTSSRPGLHV